MPTSRELYEAHDTADENYDKYLREKLRRQKADERVAELERKLEHEQKLTGIQYGKVYELERERTNCEELLVHYGFDKGSIPQRIDDICAGLVDATEALVKAWNDIKELEQARDRAWKLGFLDGRADERERMAKWHDEMARGERACGFKAEQAGDKSDAMVYYQLALEHENSARHFRALGDD